jgi:hypothetical protein
VLPVLPVLPVLLPQTTLVFQVPRLKNRSRIDRVINPSV